MDDTADTDAADTANDFHRLWFEQRTFFNTFWRGVPIYKNPMDLHVYQEILFEIAPDLIIETGTANGGSALFLADMLTLIGTTRSRVISIDIRNDLKLRTDPRLTYLTGSSLDPAIVSRVESLTLPGMKVMVVLDSDHTTDHVYQEMITYGPMVTAGSYMIVEDSNINGHPVLPGCGPGPFEAIERFLVTCGDFAQDRSREYMLMTFNPGGFLKRKSTEPCMRWPTDISFPSPRGDESRNARR